MDAVGEPGLRSLMLKVSNPHPESIYTALRITSKAGGAEIPAADFMQSDATTLTDILEAVSQVLFIDR